MPPRTYRRHELPAAGSPLTVEIRGRDGTRLLVRGVLDGVPESFSNVAQRILITDAVAEVLPA